MVIHDFIIVINENVLSLAHKMMQGLALWCIVMSFQ